MGRVLPILFNTDMVLAILDGRKTVTRRVVKKSQCMLADRKEPHELDRRHALFDGMTDAELVACTYRPPYKPGDTLYVRETWCKNADSEEYYYAANRETGVCAPYGLKWRPSIHMPKQAARIWLRVMDVRVERLQDMTGQDILQEGVNCHVHPEAHYFEGNKKMMFEEVWNSTIKRQDLDRYGWDANPWVWVIEFERCEKQMEG